MEPAQQSTRTAAPSVWREARGGAPCCASCGGSLDLRAYGAALFCRDCREMSDPFYRKDLYCDLGGGD